MPTYHSKHLHLCFTLHPFLHLKESWTIITSILPHHYLYSCWAMAYTQMPSSHPHIQHLYSHSLISWVFKIHGILDFKNIRVRNLKMFVLIKSCYSSVQFSCSVVFDSLRPHESQHTRPPCPSQTPGWEGNRQEGQGSPNGGNSLQVSDIFISLKRQEETN